MIIQNYQQCSQAFSQAFLTNMNQLNKSRWNCSLMKFDENSNFSTVYFVCNYKVLLGNKWFQEGLKCNIFSSNVKYQDLIKYGLWCVHMLLWPGQITEPTRSSIKKKCKFNGMWQTKHDKNITHLVDTVKFQGHQIANLKKPTKLCTTKQHNNEHRCQITLVVAQQLIYYKYQNLYEH